jgi:hypothetical protein
MGRAPARSDTARPKKVQMEKQDRERASAPIAQERVRRNSQKKRRDVQRRTRGSASLPAPAERLVPIISTVHTNDSTLTRNEGLLVSPLLELFLDRSEGQIDLGTCLNIRHIRLPALTAANGPIGSFGDCPRVEARHQSRSSATGDLSRFCDYENFLRRTRGQHPDGGNRSGWRTRSVCSSKGSF